MSYTYLQEQGEESLAESYSDIPQFVLSRLNLTAAKFCSSGSATESCRDSQFGTTSEPLTENLGEDELTSCAAGSPVRTSAQPGEARESPKEPEADSGMKWLGLLVRYNHDLFSSKTVLCSESEDSTRFCEALPKWGMMRDGECWELAISGLRIKENASGFLPTSGGTDWKNGTQREDFSPSLSMVVKTWPKPTANFNNPCRGEKMKTRANKRKRPSNLGEAVFWPTPQASDNRDRGHIGMPAIQRRKEKGKQIGLGQSVSDTSGALNPLWVEWLMGWPIGWTDLKPLEMDKFHSAPHSLGKPFQAWLDVNTKALETCFQYDT